MRFVILEHDHPRLHWDLMLEDGPVLRTWRLPRPPSADNSPMLAEGIGDHRLEYLDYEGPVSGGRGQVKRWDRGEYTVETREEDARLLRFMGEKGIFGMALRSAGDKAWEVRFVVL